jgi:predicted nucleotidyltransferase
MTFDDLIKTFKVQPELDKNLWDENNKLHPSIRNALLKIAKHFYDNIDLENKPPIKDVVFTGSLANYNYSRLSDIDLHLLFDFGQYGESKEVFEKFFLLAKASWNNKHDVSIKGYDVEVYAEDENNPHHSTGLYSVQNDEWIKVPEKVTPVFDKLDVKSKVQYFIDTYKQLIEEMEETPIEDMLERVELLRDKIVKFRQGGLETGGEYSTENVTFKALRRIGYLDKLADLKTHLTDKKLSVENSLWEMTYE